MICLPHPPVLPLAVPERSGGKVMPRSGTTGHHIMRRGVGDAQPSHIVVSLVVADFTDVQNHRHLAEVLPPVRCALSFGPDLAGLVMDWPPAIAGVFDDLALLDENQRRPVVMAVPRDYAARLDDELAESQLAAGNFRPLFTEIDRAERGVGHADGLEIDRLARIRHALICRAFARLGVKCKAGRGNEGRGSDGAKQAFAN